MADNDFTPDAAPADTGAAGRDEAPTDAVLVDEVVADEATVDEATADMFGEAPAPTPESAAYTVIARKYRPKSFDDLIGQEAMVRTLKNAFATGRIAHAFMLTGVRGVGKTTTARLLARALNYDSEAIHEPSVTALAEGEGRHCRSIVEGRHMDVLELDAASPQPRRRDARAPGRGPLRAGGGPLQGLHHRRSAHAFDRGVQCAAEDARGAAAARQVHLRHHRDPQGPGDHPVALPALRPAAGRAGGDRRPTSRRSPRPRARGSRPTRSR